MEKDSCIIATIVQLTIVASSTAIFQRFPLHTYCGRTSKPFAFFRHGVTHGVFIRAMWCLQMFCNRSVIYYEVESGHQQRSMLKICKFCGLQKAVEDVEQNMFLTPG